MGGYFFYFTAGRGGEVPPSHTHLGEHLHNINYLVVPKRTAQTLVHFCATDWLKDIPGPRFSWVHFCLLRLQGKKKEQ